MLCMICVFGPIPNPEEPGISPAERARREEAMRLLVEASSHPHIKVHWNAGSVLVVYQPNADIPYPAAERNSGRRHPFPEILAPLECGRRPRCDVVGERPDARRPKTSQVPRRHLDRADADVGHHVGLRPPL